MNRGEIQFPVAYKLISDHEHRDIENTAYSRKWSLVHTAYLSVTRVEINRTVSLLEVEADKYQVALAQCVQWVSIQN
jgi:hypothetical protein